MNKKQNNALIGFVAGFITVFGGCTAWIGRIPNKDGAMLIFIVGLIVGGLFAVVGAAITKEKE